MTNCDGREERENVEKISQRVPAALITYRRVRHADLEISHVAASISNSGEADAGTIEIENERKKCLAKQTNTVSLVSNDSHSANLVKKLCSMLKIRPRETRNVGITCLVPGKGLTLPIAFSFHFANDSPGLLLNCSWPT